MTQRLMGSNGPALWRKGVTPGGRKYEASRWLNAAGETIWDILVLEGTTHYRSYKRNGSGYKARYGDGKRFRTSPEVIQHGPKVAAKAILRVAK